MPRPSMQDIIKTTVSPFPVSSNTTPLTRESHFPSPYFLIRIAFGTPRNAAERNLLGHVSRLRFDPRRDLLTPESYSLAYNREVDDALPLDDVIKPDLQLRKLLEDMDKGKVKMWLFTNAHITHARRVVRLLGVEDCFEGITYCDYAANVLLAKPHKAMFEKAESEAGATSREECYFVDDSALNCRHANERGWTAVHKLEEEDSAPESKAGKYQIRDLEELRSIFPQFFVKHSESARETLSQL